MYNNAKIVYINDRDVVTNTLVPPTIQDDEKH